MQNTFSFVDLFAGIGGFRLGLEAVGGTCAGFSEIHKDAITYYCKNFGEAENVNLGDVTQLGDLPQHDLLTAGVPCQSWSIAGRNLGFDDDRGQLWNDTIYLLNKNRPKAFIFENVKGLSDPRNQNALSYILHRIADAGYFAKHFVINSADLGVPQNRIRVYVIGFLKKENLDRFVLPQKVNVHVPLSEILGISAADEKVNGLSNQSNIQRGILGNDYFLFNDIRGGSTTIHSWDLIPTSEREKKICLLLLRNRRKKAYGSFDGNPLSFAHFQQLDSTIEEDELLELVKKDVFKRVAYEFSIRSFENRLLTGREEEVLNEISAGRNSLELLKESNHLRKLKIPIRTVLEELTSNQILEVTAYRYEFRFTKISTGINGINRVFLPSSEIFPTLVASDTNDFVALKNVEGKTEKERKRFFLENIYQKELFRKINKIEACRIQGFPAGFALPENRARWMKLVGNSVSVPVIQALGKAIVETGCMEMEKSREGITVH